MRVFIITISYVTHDVAGSYTLYVYSFVLDGYSRRTKTWTSSGTQSDASAYLLPVTLIHERTMCSFKTATSTYSVLY